MNPKRFTLIELLVVIAIIRSMVRDKQQGKSSCGANCAHCAMGGTCHNRK